MLFYTFQISAVRGTFDCPIIEYRYAFEVGRTLVVRGAFETDRRGERGGGGLQRLRGV